MEQDEPLPEPAPAVSAEQPAERQHAERHPVRLVVCDDLRRSRLTVLFRLLLALPHLVWLFLWGIAAWFAAVANWLAVVLTGETPTTFHGWLGAYVRYTTHVYAYLLLGANPFPGFTGKPGYPVDIEFDAPARQSRWSASVRLVLALPALVLASIVAPAISGGYGGGVLVVAAFLAWFAALVLGRLTPGLRDLVAYGLGYSAQALAYALLVTGRYPDSDPDRLLPEATPPSHPVRLRLDDDLRRSRFTVLFRLLLTIPHGVWLVLWSIVAYLAAVANWLVALVIGRSARPLHRFLAAYVRYSSHVSAYLFLIGNPFPGFTGRQGSYPVDVEIDGPDGQRRPLTLFRLVLALPALLLYGTMATLLAVIGFAGWFAALITGRMPRGLRSLGAFVIRYSAQTTAYWLVLTDRYPNATPTLRPPAAEAVGEAAPA